MDTNGDSKIIVAASGYFDPVHIGHLEYLKLAKEFANSKGAKLVVIVDDDVKCKRKKGFEFMPFKERVEVIRSLKFVDEVFPSIDKEQNVCASLAAIKPSYFVKGGDRISGNTPEEKFCKENNIEMIFGLGGKVQSSSWLIDRVRQEDMGQYTNVPVGVNALIVDENGILLGERGQNPNKGEFRPIGGFAELGESLEEALKREVLEEIGCDVVKVEYVKSVPNKYDGRNMLDVFFWVRIEGTPKTSEEITGFKYVDTYEI